MGCMGHFRAGGGRAKLSSGSLTPVSAPDVSPNIFLEEADDWIRISMFVSGVCGTWSRSAE